MSVYIDEALEAIDELQAYCERYLARFDDGTTSQVLLGQVDDFEARIKDLIALLPAGISLGDWPRAAHFMRLFFKKDDRESCRSDLSYFTNYSLPAAAKQLRDWARKLEHFDDELRRKIAHSIRGRDFASAIRAAFVVLSERIRKKFSLSPTRDGQELVNDAFGGKAAALTPHLTPDQRQGVRDYLAGAYALLRNKYGHGDPPMDLVELEATLATINYALRIIGECPDAKPAPTPATS